MTESNQKRLYEHFLKIGNTDAAEAILAVYPQFEEKKKEAKK